MEAHFNRNTVKYLELHRYAFDVELEMSIFIFFKDWAKEKEKNELFSLPPPDNLH